MIEQHYTLEEVSTLLKISVRALRARIKSGDLKAVKIGKEYRVAESDLNDYLSRQS